MHYYQQIFYSARVAGTLLQLLPPLRKNMNFRVSRLTYTTFAHFHLHACFSKCKINRFWVVPQENCFLLQLYSDWLSVNLIMISVINKPREI